MSSAPMAGWFTRRCNSDDAVMCGCGMIVLNSTEWLTLLAELGFSKFTQPCDTVE